MKYRPEIDGLRAVAVLPVIFYHAGFTTFSGGFVGVDIFFVISGYLITGIIHREIMEGRFSVVRFYERRIRRIIPALLFVCLCCIPFSWMWMDARELKDFAQSLIAVNLFSSNFLFWIETDYFGPASELKPLLHTWSLAVEEQFYVFFPLILLLLRRLPRAALAGALAAMALTSFAFCLWLLQIDPSANFYLLPSRAWELGAGGLLAVLPFGRDKLWGWVRSGLASLGLALILFAVLEFNDATPFPNGWALLPVTGSVLVIAFASRQTFVGRLLSLAPLRSIGLISYSAYLWHQPLFAFARLRLLNAPTQLDYLALSIASLVLAYLSWRYIERPFRMKGLLTRRHVYGFAAACCSLVTIVGAVGHAVNGFPARISPAAARMAAWADTKNPRFADCRSRILASDHPDDWCVYAASGENTKGEIAFWGDSHADALAYFLAPRFGEQGYDVRPLTASGCPGVAGIKRPDLSFDCTAFNGKVTDYIRSHDNADIVVVVSRWALFFEGTHFDNEEGGEEPGASRYALPADKGLSYINDPHRIDELGRLVRQSVQSLLSSGKKVVLVYPIPEVGWNVPLHLAKKLKLGLPLSPPLSTSHEVYEKRTRNARAQLDAIPDSENLIRFRPAQVLCNTIIPGRCVAQLDDAPLYVDDDHPSRIGAGMLGEAMLAEMAKRGWLPSGHPGQATQSAVDADKAPWQSHGHRDVSQGTELDVTR